MPNRIIRESVCKSDSIEELSWFEEVFFYRLIVNCDDYGRYDARPKILKADLFPLKEGVTLSQIDKALDKLSTAGIVQVYMYDQKPFLQLVTWEKYQSVRNKRSKYPEPPIIEGKNKNLQAFEINCNQLQSIANEFLQEQALESSCNQLHANVPVIQSESLSKSESESLYESQKDAGDIFSNYDFTESLRITIEDWLIYKKERRQTYKPTGLKSLLTQIKNNVGKYGENQVIALIIRCMASNYDGIIWEKLSQCNPGGNNNTNGGGVRNGSFTRDSRNEQNTANAGEIPQKPAVELYI